MAAVMARPAAALLLSPFVGQRLVTLLARRNTADLTLLSDLMANGRLTPFIDRSYSLLEVPEAMRYVEAGHARGKVVITVNHQV
jgi:NADPH:quinone reductase-like Zn-dependent oxidoreductase